MINNINNNSNNNNTNKNNNNNSNSKTGKNTISNKNIIIINLNLLPWNGTTKFIMQLELLTTEFSVLWFAEKKNRKWKQKQK